MCCKDLFVRDCRTQYSSHGQLNLGNGTPTPAPTLGFYISVKMLWWMIKNTLYPQVYFGREGHIGCWGNPCPYFHVTLFPWLQRCVAAPLNIFLFFTTCYRGLQLSEPFQAWPKVFLAFIFFSFSNIYSGFLNVGEMKFFSLLISQQWTWIP